MNLKHRTAITEKKVTQKLDDIPIPHLMPHSTYSFSASLLSAA